VPLAVLRRSERTRFSSASEDEVGEREGAIRAERALASGAIKPWSKLALILAAGW